MSVKVSVIIPCLWTEPEFFDLTVNCLKSLRRDLQILLIADDASFASNVNKGLSAATGDIIIVSNNDVEFIQADWLDHLLKPLKEGYGIASIRTSDADGWGVEDRYEDNAKFGSLWAMTRETYNTLGRLDESFGRGYYEDLDYWRRAQEAGIKITKNHAGLVEHKGAATFNKFGDKLLKMHYEAMLNYANKYPDSTYLMPQGDGLILLDEYDLPDMTEDEVKNLKEMCISREELVELIKKG